MSGQLADGGPVTTLVIPTIGRPSLARLICGLLHQRHPVDAPVIVVDDRPASGARPLEPRALDPEGRLQLQVLTSDGGGPARARNTGWRRAVTPWVTFLDDDVLPERDWYGLLLGDLADAGCAVGSQGRIVVPAPEGRPPTDDERSTIGLAGAWWITADMSYRRDALARVGGFDERFRRAFREDTDIALRLGADNGTIGHGERRTAHPVKHGDLWFSVRQQAGNADDRLMRRLHGRDWRERGRVPRGRIRRHTAITGAGVLALAAAGTRRPGLAAAAAAGWLLGTAELAWARIRPGPRTAEEIRRMVITSAVLPPVAVGHALRGAVRHANAAPWKGLPEAVLFDRDGTLVHDVPYNGDPELVRPVPRAREVLDRLRSEGIRIAMVTNQSGIGTGRLEPGQVVAVNRRVEELLGRFDGIYLCPHAPDAGCKCRKPEPGLIERACREIGVDPARCVVIGDIGSDVEAAQAAGASGVLVPTEHTRPAEVAAAPRVAPDLATAVAEVLGGRW